MNYTQIKARVADQHLQLINVPPLASGGVNVLQITVEFCDLWSNAEKTAVFYKTPSEVFHVLMEGNAVVVPKEMLADEGYFFFGILGTTDGQIRTTEVLQIHVAQGAITLSALAPAEPTPDIYSQLVTMCTEARAVAKSVREDFDAGAIPALLDQNSTKGFRFWSGTSAEYEAQKDIILPGTLCVIIDDPFMNNIADLLTQLKSDVDSMKGVYLGTTPFQVDIMNFDYFVVHSSASETPFVFHVVNKNTADFTMTAEWRAAISGKISDNEYQTRAQLIFIKSDDGYEMGAIHQDSTGEIVQFAWEKIYGFKYPIAG